MSFVFFQNLSVIFFTDTSGNSSQCGIFCEGLKCSLAVVGGQQRCVSDSGGVTVTDIKICPPCDSVLLTHSLMCLLLNLQNTVKQKDTDGGVMSNSCVETLKQFSLVSAFSLTPVLLLVVLAKAIFASKRIRNWHKPQLNICMLTACQWLQLIFFLRFYIYIQFSQKKMVCKSSTHYLMLLAI